MRALSIVFSMSGIALMGMLSFRYFSVRIEILLSEPGLCRAQLRTTVELTSIGSEAVEQACAPGALKIRLAAATRRMSGVPRRVSAAMTVAMADLCAAFAAAD